MSKKKLIEALYDTNYFLGRTAKSLKNLGTGFIKGNLGIDKINNIDNKSWFIAYIGDTIIGGLSLGYYGLRIATIELAQKLNPDIVITPSKYNPVDHVAGPLAGIGAAVGMLFAAVNCLFLAPYIHDNISKYRYEKKLNRKLTWDEYYLAREKKSSIVNHP